MKFSRLLEYISGFPKTILFNFKYFPLRVAIKFPVLISKNVLLKNLGGTIELPDTIKSGMIKIGFGYVGIFDKNRARTILENSGKIIFHGTCSIGHGSKISVGKNGILTIGENFTITAESSIICFKSIIFGKRVLISWDCLIMDTDFHRIRADGKLTNPDKPIQIGNNVWICCRNLILKGSKIPDGCVIAAGSLTTGKFDEINCIIGGNPSKIFKSGITWGE